MQSLLCGLMILAAASEVDDRQAAANMEAINRSVKAVLARLQSEELTEAQRQKIYGDELARLRKAWDGRQVVVRIRIDDVEWQAESESFGRQQPARAVLSFDESAKWELANPQHRRTFALPMKEADALKIKKGSLFVVRGAARIAVVADRLADDPEGSWVKWFGCDQGLQIDKPTFRIEPPAKKSQPD